MQASRIFRILCVFAFSNFIFTHCLSGPAFDLAPKYSLPNYVVPENWNGSGPFTKKQHQQMMR